MRLRGSQQADTAPRPGRAYSVDRQKQLVTLGLRKRRRVQKNTPLDEDRCPYCLTGFNPGDQVVLCPACRMAHHVECWIENEGCCSYGCEAAPLRTLPVLTPSESAPSPPPTGPLVAYMGPIVCTCGNPLAEGEGHCTVCGRSRGDMHPPRGRPVAPPRVESTIARDALRAAAISFLIAMAGGAVVAFLGAGEGRAAFAALFLGVAVAYCWYGFIGVRDAIVALRDLRTCPFEYGRGKALLALGLCILGPGAGLWLGGIVLHAVRG